MLSKDRKLKRGKNVQKRTSLIQRSKMAKEFGEARCFLITDLLTLGGLIIDQKPTSLSLPLCRFGRGISYSSVVAHLYDRSAGLEPRTFP